MPRTGRALSFLLRVSSQLLWLVASVAIVAGCNDPAPPVPVSTSLGGGGVSADSGLELGAAHTWIYQIQGLEEPGAVSRLDRTDYDLMVVEPTGTVRDTEKFETRAMVRALGTKPDGSRRLVLAYIDIGQAESYRTYWQRDWRPPGKSAGSAGQPDFLLASDPDGWSGAYTVAYWRRPWQEIWIGGPTGMDGGRFLREGLVHRLAEAGFDGVYLDWVEAYEDDVVVEAARADGVDPAAEMLSFIERIKEAGKSINPGFLVMTQNAPYLLDKDPDRYESVVDGSAAEDTWYSGRPGAGWADPAGGGVPNTSRDQFGTQALLRQFDKYKKRGIPVFTVDYLLEERDAAAVYRAARKAGLRPLVTRVSLARPTETPPPPQNGR